MAKANSTKSSERMTGIVQIIIIVFFLVLVLGTMVVASNIAADQREQKKEEEAAAQMQENLQQEAAGEATVVNPITEYASAAALAEATGITLPTPAGASDIRYSSITVEGYDSPIAQSQFALNGFDCSYRVCALPAFQDISGLYFEWAVDETATVNTVPWQVKVNADGTAGVALCYGDDGLMRTLTLQGTGITVNSVTAAISALQR